MKVRMKFTFDAAHYLPDYPGKCRNLHGHTYELCVTVEGPVHEESGMVIDFVELSYKVNTSVINILDHRLLNEVISNPTAERIAEWIGERLRAAGLNVVEISLKETPKTEVIWEPSKSS